MTVHIPSSGLEGAINELYDVFRPYRVYRHPQGCPCCVSDEDNRRLFSKRLEELSAEDLDRFARKSLTTWGSVEDLKHFLPRLFELIAKDDCNLCDREVLFSKLRLGAWKTWPEIERGSVESYFSAVWADCLVTEAGSVWLDELLCGLGNAVDDLGPFLNSWETCRQNNGYCHLISFVDWNSATIFKRNHLANPFWSDVQEQMFQVVNWLANQETVRSLQEVFDEDPSSNASDALATAIDRLTAFQRSLQTK